MCEDTGKRRINDEFLQCFVPVRAEIIRQIAEND